MGITRRGLLLFLITLGILTATYGREFFRAKNSVPGHHTLKDSSFTDEKSKKTTSPEKPLEFNEKDWNYFIIAPYYYDLASGKELSNQSEETFTSYGSMNLNLSWGKSWYTNDRYKSYAEDEPVSRVVTPGFMPQQELLLHMEGKVGERLTVYIDHDSRRQQNEYLMQYRAVEDDEIIREINAGDIEIHFDHSKYAVYDSGTAKALGIDMTMRKDDLTVKGFGSVSKGERAIERFRGTTTPASISLADYQFTRGMYYQLEPFLRYDGITLPASVPTDTTLYNLVVFDSDPPSPSTYEPHPVNISSAGFELWIDDQNPHNNGGARQLSIDGGWYTRMVQGRDYSIHYGTGVITLLTAVPSQSRIYALYNAPVSSDPAVRTDVVAGKNFVFIKYGTSINEDTDFDGISDGDRNGDGKLNLDAYEIRGIYHIGAKEIDSTGFSLRFTKGSDTFSDAEKENAGPYRVDYTAGTVTFNLREPFKGPLTGDSGVPDHEAYKNTIYTENQSTSAYSYSRYKMNFHYRYDSRTFRLSHFNILEGSVLVKVNGQILSPSLYSVDHLSGYFTFIDPNNPIITPDTDIEISYEYLPPGASENSFIGGVRTDYRVNRSLNIGGTLLYEGSPPGEIIPDVNGAPDATTVIETDADLRLSSSRITRLLRRLGREKKSHVPVEFHAYGEYARSYRATNTFGKGLVDNMESQHETVILSTAEWDWILASLPSTYNESDRGTLTYRFYRDPDSPGILHDESWSPVTVPYSTKPGPYNVATGHLASSIAEKESQRSLVLEFDHTGTDATAVTLNRLSESPLDLSGLQYIEISYRYTGSDGVNLSFQLGRINEDSDGDGILDTEDRNRNGVLDTDPSGGYEEDRGYDFNGLTTVGAGPGLSSATSGDGTLTSEDLNGNGTLDTVEEVVTLPDAALTDPAALSLSSSTSWKTTRIYLDPSLLDAGEKQTLSSVEAIRLLLEGTGLSGTLYIDSIRLVTSRWRDPQHGADINNPMTGTTASSSELKVTTLSSLYDSDYRAGAFLFAQEGLYTSLYGQRDGDELNSEDEHALQFSYNLTGAVDYVSVTRAFSKPLDLRFYKSLVLWHNARSDMLPGTRVGIVLGSSYEDYVFYSFEPTGNERWEDTSLALTGDGSGLQPLATTGSPDMGNITFMKVYIYGAAGSGTFWLNDIYATEPETLVDSAHYVEGEMKVLRPLHRTKAGTPILSDLNLRYLHRGHGAHFSSVGSPDRELAERESEIATSSQITPAWYTGVRLVRSETESSSTNVKVDEWQRGTTETDTVYIDSRYHGTGAVPTVFLTYRRDNYRNTFTEDYSGDAVSRITERIVHAPQIVLYNTFDSFLGGTLNSRLSMDMNFSDQEIRRSSDEIANVNSVAIAHDVEKTQHTSSQLSFDYRNSYFFLSPSFQAGSKEVVTFSGGETVTGSTIQEKVNGDYHFPFLYDNDMKWVERRKAMQFRGGMTLIKGITPSYHMSAGYDENGFRDDEHPLDTSGSFTRSRDSFTSLQSGIDIPFEPHQLMGIDFWRSMALSYRRSIRLSENSVPYEGESASLQDEEFGLTRSVSGIAPGSLNLVRYYPGNFYTGRNSYARGRDYVNSTVNSPVTYSNGVKAPDYGNALRLNDTFSLNSVMKFNRFDYEQNASVTQTVNRSELEGIPLQQVRYSMASTFSFDLMKFSDKWFFRPNRIDLPHHASTLDLGYMISDYHYVTSNIEEIRHTPSLGLTFKWKKKSLIFETGMELRRKFYRQFLPENASIDDPDYIYIQNLSTATDYSEKERGYDFSVLYETDVPFIFNAFSKLYRLTAPPVFWIRYSMLFNRYNYTEGIEPQPYDLYQVDADLTLDLHANIQGGVSSMVALERFYNRENGRVSKEILSIQGIFHFSLLF